jgi:hypothetical protein
MHFNLKRAVALLSLPLLGGTLAVAAAAPPASAQTWQDTALVAFHVVQPTPPTTHGAVVPGVFSNGHTTLTFNAPRGQVFIPTATLTPPASPTTFDVKLVPTAQRLVLTGGSGTGTGTLTFKIGSANPAITYFATQTVSVTEASGGVLSWSLTSSVPSETVAVSVFNNNATGTVTFSGAFGGTSTTVPGLAFAQSNLPNGLVSGNPLVPGTAFPRIYTGVIYTATDALGSTFSGTFSLNVIGHEVPPPPPPPGNYGNEVNPFGNGFDVYQQHQAVNAIIAGWTATQADPATHFIRHPGTVPGAFTYEYAPNGAGTGLFVSDPGYDAAGTGLTNGLVLRTGNNGPWQQFIPQPNGTLRNVATGLIVSPNGTGAQLRGTVAPTPWGGSVYTWTDFAHLPG